MKKIVLLMLSGLYAFSLFYGGNTGDSEAANQSLTYADWGDLMGITRLGVTEGKYRS